MLPGNRLAMPPCAAPIPALLLLSRDGVRLYAPVSLGQPWQPGH